VKNKILLLLVLGLTGCVVTGTPVTEQNRVLQTKPRTSSYNAQISIMKPASTWPGPPSTIASPAPLPPIVDTVTVTTVYTRTVPVVVESATTNTTTTQHFTLR